jgi:hypothetical protein
MNDLGSDQRRGSENGKEQCEQPNCFVGFGIVQKIVYSERDSRIKTQEGQDEPALGLARRVGKLLADDLPGACALYRFGSGLGFRHGPNLTEIPPGSKAGAPSGRARD